MTFRRDVRLDPGQVRDVRGRRVRGGGIAVGGGYGSIRWVAHLDVGDEAVAAVETACTAFMAARDRG